MSTYQAERNAEKDQEGCCSCLTFLLSTVAIVWFLSSYLGLWKAILVDLVMTLTTWILALMGIIPILGQWLYKIFAKEVIIWTYGLLQVNPDIQLSVPQWVNSVLKWILGGDEVIGSLASYTYGVGYTYSIIVSLSVVVGIILTVVRKILLSKEQD